MKAKNQLTTECAKCGNDIPKVPQVKIAKSIFDNLPMTIHAYRCDNCGHYNDLTKRRWWKERENQKP